MRTFTCSSLGSNCNEVLTAKSEERLVDMVSLHLRDAHGMVALPQEKIAEIKNLFTTISTVDAAFVVDSIFEKYRCNSDPDCTWRFIAEAETILTGRPNVHERELRSV